MILSMDIRSYCVVYYEDGLRANVANGRLNVRRINGILSFCVTGRMNARWNRAPEAAFANYLRGQGKKISNDYGGTLACTLNTRRAAVAYSAICLGLFFLRRGVVASFRCPCKYMRINARRINRIGLIINETGRRETAFDRANGELAKGMIVESGAAAVNVTDRDVVMRLTVSFIRISEWSRRRLMFLRSVRPNVRVEDAIITICRNGRAAVKDYRRVGRFMEFKRVFFRCGRKREEHSNKGIANTLLCDVNDCRANANVTFKQAGESSNFRVAKGVRFLNAFKDRRPHVFANKRCFKGGIRWDPVMTVKDSRVIRLIRRFYEVILSLEIGKGRA